MPVVVAKNTITRVDGKNQRKTIPPGDKFECPKAEADVLIASGAAVAAPKPAPKTRATKKVEKPAETADE